MIVKVLFIHKENQAETIMLFGNSYKKWETQFEEYLRIIRNELPNLTIARVWKSNAKWIGWGGLKWCSEDIFQEELNREGCQDKDPDNPNPRKYADMEFVNMPISKIEKLL